MTRGMTTQLQDPLIERLAADEATLESLKTQRIALDRQIADWEEIVRIEREIVEKRPREEPPPVQKRDQSGSENPKIVQHRPGSKTYRVYNAVDGLLAGRRTMHRKVLYERLIQDRVLDHKTTLAHFSHMLSMAKDRYATDGAGNWSLRGSAMK